MNPLHGEVVTAGVMSIFYSVAQKMKKLRASQFSPISTKILEIAKIYDIC